MLVNVMFMMTIMTVVSLLQGEGPSARLQIKRAASGAEAPAPWSQNAVSPSGLEVQPSTSTELEPATVVPVALVPEVERMLHVSAAAAHQSMICVIMLKKGNAQHSSRKPKNTQQSSTVDNQFACHQCCIHVSDDILLSLLHMHCSNLICI